MKNPAKPQSKRLLLILILAGLASAMSDCSGFVSDSLLLDKLVKGMQLSYLEKFDSANIVIDEVREEYPDSNLEFFSLAVFYSNMKHDEHYAGESEFRGRVGKLMGRLEDREDRGCIAPEEKYILGMSYVYLALLEFDLGNSPFTILKHFRKGLGRLEDASDDPKIGPEGMLGVGTYLYFKSAKAGVLRSIGIISDDRDKGIDMLRTSSEESLFSQWPAWHGLLVAWTDMEDFVRADSLLNFLMERDSTVKTIRWDGMMLEKAKGNPDGIIQHGEYLLTRYNVPNYQNFTEVSAIVAEAYMEKGNTARAKEIAKEALSKELDDRVRDRQTEFIDILNDIMED